MKKNYKDVALVFPHINFESFLLQFRDFKTSILYPGHWGAFGGAVEDGENFKQAALRELEEEVGFSADPLHFFKIFYSEELNLRTSIYYCDLTVPSSDLMLTEGLDFGLFTRKEILNEQLFSQKLGALYPVAPPLIGYLTEFFDFISKEVEAR